MCTATSTVYILGGSHGTKKGLVQAVYDMACKRVSPQRIHVDVCWVPEHCYADIGLTADGQLFIFQYDSRQMFGGTMSAEQ